MTKQSNFTNRFKLNAKILRQWMQYEAVAALNAATR